ncbi:MAG: Rrf2 family transcriptional regulator [Clostridia bacterium]|nr:Rrf2 family transcriptional regulator [Clostridia bacterium]
MKLSAKGRYGILAMYDLASRQAEGPQPLKAVAERQGIPEAYLEQLMGKLRKAGLVNGTRGSQGGYELARDARDILVGEIIRTLESDFGSIKCLEDGVNCSRAHACPTYYVWKRVYDGLNGIVDSMTLKDLVESC